MALGLSGTPQSATGTGATCTLNVPATPAVGDALVAMISVDTVVTFTKPGTFTLIGTQSDAASGNDQIMGAWYRICDGTEGASFAWTFASNAFAGGMILIHSSLGTVAFDTFTPTQTAANASIVAAGLNTAIANEMLVGGFAVDTSSGTASYVSGAMTERIDVTTANFASIQICTEIFAGPGATGTRTSTATAPGGIIGDIAILAAFKEVAASLTARGLMMMGVG